ncbi:hypothetical protein [Chitinophaga sp. sic0106]|uniref:hypothetical protein n=1 Tax=Chitinophaga sp. sic0106 TaxID=2854785 RepID=UPI001C43A97E|nr:hypothetical protein [Chitinophaga sp. sic0106]MBV7532440.1 hypothetical protein [Chitinophaga sp. sic0106]
MNKFENCTGRATKKLCIDLYFKLLKGYHLISTDINGFASTYFLASIPGTPYSSSVTALSQVVGPFCLLVIAIWDSQLSTIQQRLKQATDARAQEALR